MADAIRAALRLFPVTKPSTGGASVAYSRSAQFGRLAFGEQANRFPLSAQLQAAGRELEPNTVTGLARFAKAVLTYVGVGLSVVTANQFTGPSTLLAKEAKRESMSEDKSGSSWPYTAFNRCFLHRELDKETISVFAQEDPSPLENMALKDANKTEVEGLSFFSNEHWGVGDMADLPWQFGPSALVDYGAQHITLEETSMSDFQDFSSGAKKKVDCTESAEVELEWQLITDLQEQSAEPEVCPVVDGTNICKEDSGESAVKSQKDVNETVGKLERVTSDEFPLSDGAEIKSGAPGSSDSSRKSGNLFKELVATKHLLRENSSWRTADSEELAALVSQKTLEHLENCDLPPAQSSFTRKGPLASCDFAPPTTNTFEMSQSVDKLLLASLLHGHEPTQLENKSLPSSPLIMGMSDPTPLNQSPAQLSQPLAIPAILPHHVTPRQRRCSSSSDDRNTSWNGSSRGSSSVTGRGSDTLGEALCHSQTRAREAEKAAFQALHDKEQVVKLLFREARTCCTYKHWVQSLEMENMWLKMCAGDESRIWMKDNILRPVTSNSFANNRWRHLGKQPSRKKMQHYLSSVLQGKQHGRGWVSEGKVVVGCTIGLAFALGLSLAGAGLMIGWSMGWILIAY